MLSLIWAILAALPFPFVQASDNVNAVRAESVKQAFLHAWSGYTRCADSYDTLRPIECQGFNAEGAWGVTNIDSIDTALIMNLTDIANKQILTAVKTDFSKLGPGEENEGLINAFETTIRVLGSLLSVHDLLLNGFGEHIPSYETKAQQFLIQAKSLADTLGPIYNTLSGLPAAYLNLSTTPPLIYRGSDVGALNSAAGIGTSQLEYARLSNLTDLPAYVDRSVIAARHLFKPEPEIGIALSFPGLIGSKFNFDTGEMVSEVGGWTDSVVSYYEYLLKLYIYNPVEYPDFLAQYKLVARSTRDHLLSHPITFPNATYLAAYAGKQQTYNSQHLTCMSGGNLLQASIFLNDPELATMGEDLIAGCRFVAKHTSKGMLPEQWIWSDLADPVPTVEPTELQALYIAKHGYWAPDGQAFYNLRPEYFESLFYGYRITKNEKYRDWAWEAFLAMNSTCYTTNGYVGSLDVTVKRPDTEQGIVDAGLDGMESFFLAETLKYAYLIFQEDSLVSLDDWVFNTEGHPLRIQARDVERKANVDCFKHEWCVNSGWY